MSALQVYSRQGCHLCEVLIEELLPLVRSRLEIQVNDIDSRPDWVDAYGTRVPVVEFNGQLVCQYTLDREAVQRIVDDARGS